MVAPYYAQRKLPAEVGVAKMDSPSFYSGREGAAIAEFAKAFGATGDLAMKRLNSIAQTEYTTGKADWETAHNVFFEGLRDDPDHKNYVNKYEQDFKKIQKDILATKSPVVKKILSEMFESKTPSVLKSIGNVAWDRKSGAMAAETLTSVRKFELSGNSGAAEAALIEAVSAGTMDAKEAAGRALQIKRNIDWNNGYRLTESDPAGLLEILDKGVFENLDAQDIEQLRTRARTLLSRKAAVDKEQIELQREADRDTISKAIQSAEPNIVDTIDESSLDEAEQWTWNERARADMKRRAEGVEIVTDHEVRSKINSGIFQMLTGAKTKKEVLDEAKAARFDPVKPTLNQSDYEKVETAINAQYEQAYMGAMSKVESIARGTLLNPDSLGYIKNAPIRYKTMADFQQAWMKWIADKGDTLKITDIYPEGVRMAAMYQISDKEAERQEVEMNLGLEEREKPVAKVDLPEAPPSQAELEKRVGKENAAMETKAWGVIFDLWDDFPRKIQEKIRKDRGDDKTFSEIVSEEPVAGEISKALGITPSLPEPKDKTEYDKLKSGTKYLAPDGNVRTKQ